MTESSQTTNGRPQRSKIPRTTQVRRLHQKARTALTLKAWAKQENTALTKAWLKAKA